MLILASASAYRRELLGRLGVDFRTEIPGVSETHRPGEPPAERARRLSLEKARAVSRRHPGALVIGSDQVASVADTILDKPGDAPACREQLAALSGRTALFHTGCALVRDATPCGVHVDTTTVVFRTLGREEIGRYVERDRPFDCAGGFRAEALGSALFERLETGDPTAIIGLPLIWVAGALRAAGVPVP